MWENIFLSWKNYMGTGLMLLFFAAAWLYLFLKEKEMLQRVVFVYIPLAVLLLFFNPLVYKLFDLFGQGPVYFRVLWLVPFSVVLAYTAVKIYTTLKEGRDRRIFLAVTVALTVAGGRCVYSSPLFQRAENLYHMPDPVVHICDAIEIKGREVVAVFPLEMVLYVRQYSPLVVMPYGRDIFINGGPATNELCTVMESDEPDAGKLGELARRNGCVYIVLSEEKKLQGDLLEQGYDFFGETDGYRIYKDVFFEPGF